MSVVYDNKIHIDSGTVDGCAAETYRPLESTEGRGVFTPDLPNTLTVPLYPAIVPEPMGYVDRIMEDGKVTIGEIFTELFAPSQPEPPNAIGMLTLDESGASLGNFAGARNARVGWDKPFVVLVSHWPLDAQIAEICVSMRTRGVHPETNWLRFRTLWPLDALGEGIPKKQDFGPYVSPMHFRVVWAMIHHAAGIQGERLADLITREVSEEEFAPLKSQQSAAHCVACNATAVEIVAPEVYRCHVCGYAGGEGYDDYAIRRKQQAYVGVAYEERLKYALLDLESARDSFMVAANYRWDVRYTDNQPRVEDLNDQRNAFKHKGLGFLSLREAALKVPEHAEAIGALSAQEDKVIDANSASRMRVQVEVLIGTLAP